MYVIQATWLSKLHEAQDRYKEAVHRKERQSSVDDPGVSAACERRKSKDSRHKRDSSTPSTGIPHQDTDIRQDSRKGSQPSNLNPGSDSSAILDSSSEAASSATESHDGNPRADAEVSSSPVHSGFSARAHWLQLQARDAEAECNVDAIESRVRSDLHMGNIPPDDRDLDFQTLDGDTEDTLSTDDMEPLVDSEDDRGSIVQRVSRTALRAAMPNKLHKLSMLKAIQERSQSVETLDPVYI